MENEEVKNILIANIWETPDGTRLWSRHAHDSVFYLDNNGERYMVDGGNHYCHLSESKEHPMKNCCVFDDVDWSVQREYRLRGTFDQDGNRVWVPLSKLSNEHLNAILEYNKECQKPLSNIEILAEIAYRKENNIEIPEHDYTFEGVQPIDSPNKYVCPRCGSKNVHCHAGMMVDRYECQECHWEWR